MEALGLTAAFTTDKLEESRDFYVKYFGAKVTFDCKWYVTLEFGNETLSLQFMTPHQPEHKLCSGDGLMYNFKVQNVDDEFNKLRDANVPITLPLEDHPWGDRGFAVRDPNGISLYIYSEREPSDQFKKYYK